MGVQLKGIGADFYLTQQGTYSIRDLLAARQKTGLAGIGKVLASSLAHLLAGPAQNQNAVLGR
jgi:hypothetical protein